MPYLAAAVLLLLGINFYPQRVKSFREVKKLRAPLATFTFDDGLVSDYLVMLPVFQAKGVVATSSVPSDLVGDSGRMTSLQLEALETAGWEIVSHAQTHTCGDNQVIIDEAAPSLATLQGLGLSVESFAYPCGTGASVASVRSAVSAAGYRAARGVTPDVNLYPLDRWSLKAINGDDPALASQYQAWIDTTNRSNGWLIFYIHGTDAADAIAIGALLDYCAAQGVRVVTMRTALTSFDIP